VTNHTDVAGNDLGLVGVRFLQIRNDKVTAAGDVIPILQLRWNASVNNFLSYGTADLPAGLYDRTSLRRWLYRSARKLSGYLNLKGYGESTPTTGHTATTLGSR
jgi:hypothetical protein